MKSLKNNIYFKIGALFIITLLLLIPKSMITGLISEREYRQDEAIQEVSSKWAEQQTISGPFISIPYYRYVKEVNPKDSSIKTISYKEYVHILPEILDVNGEISPEKRQRGIFEIVVYNSKLKISGKFNPFNINDYNIDPQNILFDKAEFVIGIDDLRGIEKQIELTWNSKGVSFNPGVSSNDIVNSGINAKVDISPSDSINYTFNLELELKGSQQLYFTPVGKITDINLTSNWPNPSFNGSFLPDVHKVTENGFKANWNVLHLNRNFPQTWIGSSHAIEYSSFGVDLKLPVDNYQKSYRASKYAILFIGFTFLAFFFIEVMNKVLIHPIQYILVGLALVIFYSLLLALSEHLIFNLSFWIAAIGTILLITLYTKAILKNTKLSAFMGGLLLILYTFIFVIIQVQDYALLIGSIGVFVILGFVMYFSRKINWYNIGKEEPKI